MRNRDVAAGSDAVAFAAQAMEIGYANGLQAAEDLVRAQAAKYREAANRAEAAGGWGKTVERSREDSAVAERLAWLIRQQKSGGA